MSAPKGNRFWEARSTHGRSPKFESAEDLLDACTQYFEWVEENPLWTSELVKFQGEAKVAELPKMRAMTIGGMCVFLDICKQTWNNYKSKGEGFLAVTTYVEQIISTQKFEGASADLLNANIIARDLGLADKSEITGENGGPVQFANLTEEEIERRIAELTGKA